MRCQRGRERDTSGRARDAPRLRRRLRRRHLHARPGHGAHDSQHARGRAAERRRDRRRRRAGPGGLDGRGERRRRRAAERVRAGVQGAQARGSRVPRLPRRPVAVGGDPRARQASPLRRRGRACPALIAPGAAGGRAQQPREPEDGRLLREPAAAVRARGGRVVRRTARPRIPLLRDDVRVADALRGRRGASRTPAHGRRYGARSTPSRASCSSLSDCG